MIPAPLEVAAQFAEVGTRRPIDHVRHTAPQVAYLSDPAPKVCWVDGNRLGKTTAICEDGIQRSRGRHPFLRTKRPPTKGLIIGYSLEQMGQSGAIMQTLWEMLPKNEISPENYYEPGRGITGKPPRIKFTSGPGKGSVINFSTYKGGAAKVAGGKYDWVAMDEPGPASLYEELAPRLLTTGGVLRIGFTPVPNMPPQQWLKDLIAAGEITKHNVGLSAAHCHPIGNPFPYVSQADIDAMARALPAHIRPMRIDGAWDPIVTDRYLSAFVKEKHVGRFAAPRGWYLAVGIDHGIEAGKQTAVLAAFADRDGLHPQVRYLAESAPEEATNPRQDANNILGMLKSVGLKWHHVDLWVGDRRAQAGKAVWKDNTRLRRHLADLVGVRPSEFGTIYGPDKGWGSEIAGISLMNAIFADEWTDQKGIVHQRAMVHERCVSLIKSCEEYRGPASSPLKDIMDGARYPTEKAIRVHPALELRAQYA